MGGLVACAAEAFACEVTPRIERITKEELLNSIAEAMTASYRERERAQVKLDNGTPLSRFDFCRIVGIDQETTLQPLIKAKLIKTIRWTKGEIRIPVAELRRIQRDGIPPLTDYRKAAFPPVSHRRLREDASAVAEAIRGLDIAVKPRDGSSGP